MTRILLTAFLFISLLTVSCQKCQQCSYTWTKVEIISTENIERNGIAMKVIKYTAKFGPEHLYFSQIFAINNNTAYALTFNAEKAKQEKYNDIEEAVLASFKLMVQIYNK